VRRRSLTPLTGTAILVLLAGAVTGAAAADRAGPFAGLAGQGHALAAASATQPPLRAADLYPPPTQPPPTQKIEYVPRPSEPEASEPYPSANSTPTSTPCTYDGCDGGGGDGGDGGGGGGGGNDN
jgi:hypothetical protein